MFSVNFTLILCVHLFPPLWVYALAQIAVNMQNSGEQFSGNHALIKLYLFAKLYYFGVFFLDKPP